MTPREEALRQVQQLRDTERDASLERIKLAHELDEVRKGAGDAVLDAMLAGGNGRSREAARSRSQVIAELRQDIENLDRAIEAARARRAAAIPAVWRAEAAGLRKQAEEVRGEANAIAEHARVHLEAAAAIEGTRFVDEFSTASRLLGAASSAGVALDAIRVAGPPRSEQLRWQAAQLEGQAADLESRQVVQAGDIAADSLEDLVAQALADPLRIAPPMGELLDWASTLAALERERREGVIRRQPVTRGSDQVKPGDPTDHQAWRIVEPLPLDSPISWRVSWRNGELDRQASSLSSPLLEAERDADNRRRGLVSRRELEPVPHGPVESTEEQLKREPHASRRSDPDPVPAQMLPVERPPRYGG